MTCSINCMDIVSELNPLILIEYLTKTQWKPYLTKRKDIAIFQYQTDEIFEQVTIPIDKNLRDYKSAMYDAICKIANIEGRPIEQQILFFINPNADILRVQIIKKESCLSSIAINEIIQLYDNIKKLLAATVLDIVDHQKIHSGRTSELVRKFISECQFGQTEVGCFTASIICPFMELTNKNELKKLSFPSDKEQYSGSLTRQITNRLITNIITIKQNIAKGNIDSLINSNELISPNFYEALNGLLHTENTTVEFVAEWASTAKDNRCKNNKVSISNDFYSPIKQIVSRIKECPGARVSVIGKVTQLKATPSIDNREFGTVVIACIGDSLTPKSVSAKLDKENYEKAVFAHQCGKTVKLVGDLKTQPKNIMENVDFSVID